MGSHKCTSAMLNGQDNKVHAKFAVIWKQHLSTRFLHMARGRPPPGSTVVKPTESWLGIRYHQGFKERLHPMY